MDDLQLRLLDPATDLDLFRRAYSWRLTPKRHTQPTRMSFETFTDTDPTQTVVGLFNGELQAAYLLHEYEPYRFDVHMTSDRCAPRENVLEGARRVLRCLFEGGAKEVSALIVARNRPLCQFVEAIGMRRVSRMRFSSCADVSKGDSIQPRNQRTFIKYAATRG